MVLLVYVVALPVGFHLHVENHFVAAVHDYHVVWVPGFLYETNFSLLSIPGL